MQYTHQYSCSFKLLISKVSYQILMNKELRNKATTKTSLEAISEQKHHILVNIQPMKLMTTRVMAGGGKDNGHLIEFV